MLISDLLSPERILCDVHSSSKKRLLELISEELARNSDELRNRAGKGGCYSSRPDQGHATRRGVLFPAEKTIAF